MASHSRKFLPVVVVSLSFLSILFYSVDVIDRALVPRFLGVAGALFLAFIAYIGFSKSNHIRIDITTWTYVGYIICAGLSVSHALNASEAWFDVLLSSLGICFFVLVLSIFKQHYYTLIDYAKYLVFISLCILCIAIIYELATQVHWRLDAFWKNEITALNSNKNLLSSYLFLLLPWFIIQPNDTKMSIRDLVSIVITIAMLGLLGSKATLLALLITIVLLVLSGNPIILKSNWSKIQKTVLSSILIAALGIACWLLVDKALHGQSTAVRFYTWDATLKMIGDHLFSGVGAGNWKLLFPTYWPYDELNMDLSTTIFQHVHNDFLQIVAEIGLPGFILFMAFIALIWLRKSTPETRHHIRLFKAFLTGWMAIAFTDFPLHRVEHLLAFNLLLATIYLGTKSNIAFLDVKIPKPFLFLFCIPLIYACYVGYFQYRGELNTQKLLDARFNGQSTRVIKLADKALHATYSLDPTSVPIRWYKGLAQAELGNIQVAKETFELAQNDHPYAIMVYKDLATADYVLGNLQEAENGFVKTLQFYPDYDEARMNLGFLYLNAGKYKEAREALQKLPGKRKIKFLHEIVQSTPPVIHNDPVKQVFYEVQDEGIHRNNAVHKLIKQTLIANQLRESLYWQQYLPEEFPGKYNLLLGIFLKAKKLNQFDVAQSIATFYQTNNLDNIAFKFSKVRFLIEEKEFVGAAELYQNLPLDEIQKLPNHNSVRKFFIRYDLI